MSEVKTPNRELLKIANGRVMKQTKILYQGEEGLVVSATTDESREFWENGERAQIVGNEDFYMNKVHEQGDGTVTIDQSTNDYVSQDYPLIFLFPYTDNPNYSGQSSYHSSISPYAGGFDLDEGGCKEVERKPFIPLLNAAVDKNPSILKELLYANFAFYTLPSVAWKNSELTDFIIEGNPSVVWMMNEEDVTPDILIKGIREEYKEYGLSGEMLIPDLNRYISRGVGQLFNESPETFKMLSNDQWQELEQEMPGMITVKEKHIPSDGASSFPDLDSLG